MSDSTNLPALPESGKKSFWDKPEGAWGMWIALIPVAIVGYVLFLIVPFILKTFLGLLGILIVGSIIVALSALMFTDNPLRQAIILKYQLFCKRLRSSIINESPIAVLRLLISKAKKRLEDAIETMSRVMGAERSTQTAAKKYNDKLIDAQSAYNIATKAGDSERAQRALIKIGQLQKYTEEMTAMSTDIGNMKVVLLKAKKVCENIIEDATDEIDNLELRSNAVKEVQGAWSKFRSIFKGNADDNEMRMEAMRAVTDQMNNDLGRIDNFMEEFKGVLADVTEKDEINAEKARIKMAQLQSTYTFEPTHTRISAPVAEPVVKALAHDTAQSMNLTPSLPRAETVPVKRVSSFSMVGTSQEAKPPAPAPAPAPRRGGFH